MCGSLEATATGIKLVDEQYVLRHHVRDSTSTERFSLFNKGNRVLCKLDYIYPLVVRQVITRSHARLKVQHARSYI